ncbi:type IV pilin protein [Synechococcus sp. MU1617]|uniref:type IV pilin protein n=1 Tax=Synechococcus sp. MU1617 TaxID=2508346 RepID=UPI001CF85576|nr:type II secretion system protein [Synechococcus sp. MU1617]MCB4389097.1 type II secretion system protein [Synechococcus sp. MU1617]
MTILELVAVVGIISILAGISVPRIGDMMTSSKIDEAKALLNTAAADCLQKNRLNENDKDTIDASIISDQRVNPIGYRIDTSNNADKCSYFQLIPLNENDNIRFPIGFSVSDGSLNKFATPTSTNTGSMNSCNRWAGVNCKQDDSLKDLVKWKQSIATARATCESEYDKWLTEKNTQPVEFTRWNSNADKGCPDRPPQDGSTSYKTDPTCTPNGCNRTVYGLDGEFVGLQYSDYERARDSKYGTACKKWEESKKLESYTNDPPNQAQELIPECGTRQYWFYKGVDLKTKKDFDDAICQDNLEKEKQTSGKRTVQGCGNQIYYFSNGKINESEKDYKESSCDIEKYEKAQAGKNGFFTTTEKGATGCGDFWICNQEIINSEASYNEKCQDKPKENSCSAPVPECDEPSYFTHPACETYSRCMGRI